LLSTTVLLATGPNQNLSYPVHEQYARMKACGLMHLIAPFFVSDGGVVDPHDLLEDRKRCSSPGSQGHCERSRGSPDARQVPEISTSITMPDSQSVLTPIASEIPAEHCANHVRFCMTGR
jgi:hypothetical protein